MQRQHFLKAAATLLATSALGLPLTASAQGAGPWPNKPIKLVVNFPAGGSPDTVARAVATPLSAALGVPVVVENRAGAGGIVGADAVAKAAPDGYTFLLSSGSAMSIVPLITPKMPFDPKKDLVPVAAGARLELFLVARADLPFTNYADFVKFVKANPGKLTYGSPGNGTSPHIAGEMLKSQAGFFSVHIPYRGSGQVLQDLLGGQIDYTFDPGIAFQHIKSGKLRLLAMGSAQRSPLYPQTPTLAELGLKGFDTGTTHGFWAPAGTPQPIVDRVNAEINKALQMPAVAKAIEALGAAPTPMSPAQFGAVIKADLDRYAVIVKERRITAD
ncbi:Bug family tripartite tricarboxylate transporter substrate binding protein [Rubrivivax rivuli]|uniref:Tripartite tricarboxylate transporter substrate binding protein n=1 Tax=Rubrivivax rivuli TaxID=1862385 RepID=A0A437R8C7_9BURK|nr:tripartite tricarboxylate transporter substrate binding protein [Rubrivivax rivuli]RVU43046.1 tripartite tricarboxylate transporter substrate binding protein [Rubrivivax rivuli]